MHSVLKIDYTCISDVIGQITIDMDMCRGVLSDVVLRVKECLSALAVKSNMWCKRCKKNLSLVTMEKPPSFWSN